MFDFRFAEEKGNYWRKERVIVCFGCLMLGKSGVLPKALISSWGEDSILLKKEMDFCFIVAVIGRIFKLLCISEFGKNRGAFVAILKNLF